ncbi:MAG: iron-sulfur cluster-binding protein [Planctomycetaceae bacterium]|nr:iron-sulfur cluster-binding protein [Planctomycetaceae bacterium]
MNANPQHDKQPLLPNRRQAIGIAGATAGLAGAAALASRFGRRHPVFIAANQRYDGPLTTVIEEGLLACGAIPTQFRDRRVLLKPNLVEPTRAIPHMTTHPAVIVAAAEVFRRWGATVTVGEAPGHVRDTRMALHESGVGEALLDAQLQFADLNYQQVAWQSNRGRYSKLKGLYLPQSVVEADVVVSMPKLKTHHWVGLTCAMKNFYGVLPGIKYGWPKNVLHHNGIPETVADVNCSLPRTLAIVDGIDCMEGDGPILGSRKHMGLLLVGDNLPAVDATAARIIGLTPERITYLALIANRLGPLADARIEQRGERWQDVADPFEILDQPHLRVLRDEPTGHFVS